MRIAGKRFGRLRIAASLLVAGFGAAAQEPPPPPPVVVSMDKFFDPNNPESSSTQQIIDFMKANPDVEVRQWGGIELPAGRASLMMALAGNTAPDIGEAWFHIIRNEIKQNFLYPLIQKRVFVSEIISFLDMTIWGHQILFRKSILENLPIMELSATVWLDSLLADIAFKGDNRNVVYVNEMLIRWRRHRSASSFGAYNQKSRTVDLRYTGVLDALRASADKERCRRVRLYFSALKRIDGISPDCRRVIGWMAECSFTSLLKAGALCLRNYTDSFPGTLSFSEKIRIFLKPFFAVRNQSKGIERIP